MKKLLVIFAVAASVTACNSGEEKANVPDSSTVPAVVPDTTLKVSPAAVDSSTVMSKDSTVSSVKTTTVTVDTAKKK